jgi:hypothetical protein
MHQSNIKRVAGGGPATKLPPTYNIRRGTINMITTDNLFDNLLTAAGK